jgi:hypothetical protein
MATLLFEWAGKGNETIPGVLLTESYLQLEKRSRIELKHCA